jgi:hypothetical protein
MQPGFAPKLEAFAPKPFRKQTNGSAPEFSQRTKRNSKPLILNSIAANYREFNILQGESR